MVPTNRRRFLKHGLLAAGGIGIGLTAFSKLVSNGQPPAFHPSYGPLRPVADATSGLPLLRLPEGFSYRTFGWAGETLADGYISPGACDGMGVVADADGVVTLIRNHELRGSSGACGDARMAWDNTGGGTSTLWFDNRTQRLVNSRISLAGTVNNCAGGVTPWGTWLSCEEAPVTPEFMHHGIESRQKHWRLENVEKSHGYVFEVPPEGAVNPEPIVAMGQMYHEAVAIDPATGVVYLTEDHAPYAGLYRYLPDVPGKLHAGGRLQMLKVKGHDELIKAVPRNIAMQTDWVDIGDPGRGHTPGTHDGAGVVAQGMAAGGTAFLSLEGCAWFDHSVYFTSKAGGDHGSGQVFRLDLERNIVELIHEAEGEGTFSGPDNIIVSPGGCLMICEDRLGLLTSGQYIAGLDASGELFAFCQVNPDLDGSFAGHDLRTTAVGSEWAGICFSKDGNWMFANIYSPGVTVAFSGPWENGPV